MKINKAIIMAAGRGMRMMPFTDKKPKAMAPYAGSTLISNGIDAISKYIPEIHITVGYKGAMLASHVIEHNAASVFNTEGKDNSWWLYNTLMKYVDSPIFVLTCDNVVELDFESLEKDYFEAGSPACMVVPVKPVKGLEGDYIVKDGALINDLTRKIKTEMYCSGIQILNPKKINTITEKSDNFYGVWKQLIAQKQLYCSNIYPKKWYAVDNLIQLEEINKLKEKKAI
ncbi:MAG: nucleotidyl transferase [Flavobacteriales bacterium]|nr:nucleotidyl transferase [Flavobacteriales bacterium]|tara:strand:- start:1334 stop:2017 length:684 start_codon:yes stop_codon:yes gene_type:complete